MSVSYPIPYCTISPGNNSTNCASDITLVQGPSCAIVNICMLKNKNPFIILRKRQFYAQEVKFSPIPGTVMMDVMIWRPGHYAASPHLITLWRQHFVSSSCWSLKMQVYKWVSGWPSSVPSLGEKSTRLPVCGIQRTPAQKRQQAQMPSLTLGGFRSA